MEEGKGRVKWYFQILVRVERERKPKIKNKIKDKKKKIKFFPQAHHFFASQILF